MGVVMLPTIAGGLPEAYTLGGPIEVCMYCTPPYAALPILLPPVTMRIA